MEAKTTRSQSSAAAAPTAEAGRRGELELEQARNGTHSRMVAEEKRLSTLKASRIARAQQLRDLRLESVTANFEAEKRAGEDEFNREKGIVQERLGQDVIDRQKRQSKV